MKVLIDRNSGKEPHALVTQMAPESREFPVVVSLIHKNVEPLVLPSSGIDNPLEPGTEYQVKVKSFEQAWLMVTDLSEFAARAECDDNEFAVVTAEAPVEAPVTTTAASMGTDTAAATPAKGKQATQAAETAKENVK